MLPSSFCTICTKACSQELVGCLLSLSIHHPNAKVFVVTDTFTKIAIDELTPQPRLDISWNITLDKYSDLDRNEMTRLGIFSVFLMAKADAITMALQECPDTLFIDSDIIILDTLYVEDPTKQLGVSPQFIQKKNVDETGYYNAGMLWTNQISLPLKWKEFTKSSRYFEQASIEDLTKEFSFFEFGENYNLQTWRFLIGSEPTNKIISYITIRNGKIYYKDSPLKFIHTHFNSDRFKVINNFFIEILTKAKYYRELLCIERLVNRQWVIRIPKQPMMGLWRHNNDSFRELAVVMGLRNKDLKVIQDATTGYCWLGKNILFYDRPTLEWINKDVSTALLLLLGNGSIDKEGSELHKYGINVKPWIFWPRRPIVLERYMKEHLRKTFLERPIESIFIGNYENNVQKKFRTTAGEVTWDTCIEEFQCTSGNVHKYTQEEYLEKMASSRFGLCLRGYGSKCHREVELMALGTVPIITPEVTIDSYMEPPIEDVHFIRVFSPQEIPIKLKDITPEKWDEMSSRCVDWYVRNVHSTNAWNTMIDRILYN